MRGRCADRRLAAPIQCDPVPLNDGVCELELKAHWPLPSGSRLRTEIGAARRNGVLKLRVTIDSVSRKGKPVKEIGERRHARGRRRESTCESTCESVCERGAQHTTPSCHPQRLERDTLRESAPSLPA